MNNLWFEYVKLCFPFISLSFCRLLVGLAVTIGLHASVQLATLIILFALISTAKLIKL